MSEELKGGRRSGEGLRTGTGTGGAFVEGYLDVSARSTRTESESSGVKPVLGIR